MPAGVIMVRASRAPESQEQLPDERAFMAAKSLTYDDLAVAFGHGNFQPLYFLFGDEGLLIDELQQHLIDGALQPHERDFNLDLFYGPEADVRQVLAACASYPMMAERRVVVVRSFEALPDNREFVSYAARPNPAAVVALLCNGKPNLNTHPYRALREKAVAVEFKSLYDRQMPGWIAERARQRGLRIDPGAAQMLAQEVGTDLRVAAGELEKLATFVGERGAVTENDVLTVAGHLREFNVFELQKALGEGDRQRMTVIAERLLDQASNRTGEALRIVAMLTWYVNRLRGLAAVQSKRLSDSEQARHIGVRPFHLKEYQRALRTLGIGRVRRAPNALLAADMELKGGSERDARLILVLAFRRILADAPPVGTVVERSLVPSS
jgi:DNA polymerase III subunit delta